MTMITCKAMFPWDMLHDFVVGEQSMRDFLCTFNDVRNLGYKEGIAENAKNKKNKKLQTK